MFRFTAQKKWSLFELETLESMLAYGASHLDIARVLNRTLGSVQAQAHSIKTNPISERRKERRLSWSQDATYLQSRGRIVVPNEKGYAVNGKQRSEKWVGDEAYRLRTLEEKAR